MENPENTMSEQFAIDKSILDEMMKYDEYLKQIEFSRVPLNGEPITPIESFKREYKNKYSVESSSPQVFAPESMADDLFEIYKGLESNEQQEAMKFLKQENKMVEDYFKKNPKTDSRKKMM